MAPPDTPTQPLPRLRSVGEGDPYQKPKQGLGLGKDVIWFGCFKALLQGWGEHREQGRHVGTEREVRKLP